jgi:NAD(P) transhydrogenase subunit alpha
MDSLVAAITVFVLAIFIGFEIITKVPPTLHTPLMSGSNAISGVALIGAILSTRTDNPKLATILGVCAVAFAMVNVVGGYMVTHRMLAMFQKKR